MSRCVINRRDAEDGNLPQLCMKCGEPSTVEVNKQFSWYPSWVLFLVLFGLLPFLIVALMTTKKMKVQVPFCERHQKHFSSRSLFAGLGLLGLILALVLILVALQDYQEIRSFLLMALGILAIVWFITLAVLGQTAIRPTGIDALEMTLVNVSQAFAEAEAQPSAVAQALRYESAGRPPHAM